LPDLDLLDQQPKDLDATLEIGILQARLHDLGERPEFPQDLAGVILVALPVYGRGQLLLEGLLTLTCLRQARLVLLLPAQPVLASADRPAHAAPYAGQQLPDRVARPAAVGVRLLEPPSVLAGKAARVGDQAPDVVPDGLLQVLRPHGAAGADPRAAVVV